MKVVADLSEPYLCSTCDPEHGFIEQFKTLLTDQQKYDYFTSFLQHVPHHMMQLTDWVVVLNEVDRLLERLIRIWKVQLICCPPESSSASPTEECSEEIITMHVVIERILVLLKFTKALLESCAGKDIYNSLELLLPLLHAYDDNIVHAAMDCLVALLMPPFNHRSEHYIKRHMTSLHKLYSTQPQLTSYIDMLFDVIDMSYLRIPLAEFFDDSLINKQPRLRSVIVDDHIYQKYTSVIQHLQNTNILVDESVLNHERQDDDNAMQTDQGNNRTAVVLSSEVQLDLRSHEEILTASPSLTDVQKITLLWELRVKRLLKDHLSKQRLLQLLYQSVYIVLNCYPTSTMLYNYFTEKMDMMKDFLALLKLGPDQGLELLSSKKSERCVVMIDFGIFSLSLRCLEAILEVKDYSVPPIYQRYPWLLFELGVSKGQYMGLLPSLLRKYCSIIQQDKATNRVTNPAILKWFEEILIFLATLINSTNTNSLSVLIDNGLVSLFLTTIQSPVSDVDSIISPTSQTQLFVADELLGVYTLIYEILENAVIHHTSACNAFREHSGVETVYTALLYEVYAYIESSSSRVSIQGNILIEEMCSLLLSYIQDGRPEVADQSLQLFYRSKYFILLFYSIFHSHSYFSTSVLMASLNLIVEIMNRDAMPPTIVNYIMQASENFSVSVLDAVLSTVLASNEPNESIHDGDFLLKNDLSILHFNFISAISITDAGISYVASNKYIQEVLDVLSCPQYYLPASRICMNQELLYSLGAAVEELIRHFPAYMKTIVKYLLEKVDGLSNALKDMLSQDNSTGDITQNDEVLLHYYYLQSYLTISECILIKAPAINFFVQENGLDTIGGLFHVVVGSPRYRLYFLSTLLDHTIQLMGYTPLKHLILHIFSLCAEHSGDSQTIPRAVFDYLTLHINAEIDLLKFKLKDYLTKYDHSSHDAKGSLFYNFLETLQRDPIHYCITNNEPLSSHLHSVSDIASNVMFLDFYIECWGFLISPIKSSSQMYPMHTTRPVFSCLHDASMIAQASVTIQAVFQDIFIPIEQEMARAKGTFVNMDYVDALPLGSEMDVDESQSCESRGPYVKVHPIYTLLIIADTVIVRESIDDSSKRVLKLYKGTKVEAYERKLASNNIVKYRTQYGWIGIYKNAHHFIDAQFLVVKIETKDAVTIKKESQVAEVTAYVTYKDKTEYEKFTNISLRRAGYLLFFHLYHTIKVNILMNITRLHMSKEIYHESSKYSAPDSILNSDQYRHIRNLGLQIIPTLFGLFENILETNRLNSTDEEMDKEKEMFEMIERITSPIPTSTSSVNIADQQSDCSSNNDNSNAFLFKQLETNYFHSNKPDSTGNSNNFSYKIPTLTEFSSVKCFHVIRLLELLQACSFDISGFLLNSKRNASSNKHEINYLFLVYLTHDKHVHILRSVLMNFVNLYMCAFDPFSSPENLERLLSEENVVLPNDYKLVTDNMPDVVAYKVLLPFNTDQPHVVKDFIYYRNRIRERRLLVISNLDTMVDMMKMMYTGFIAQPTVLEKSIFQQFTKCNSDIGQNESSSNLNSSSSPDSLVVYYDPHMLRKKMIVIFTRYISCFWITKRPYLFNLHAHHLKLIFELLVNVIKALQELKSAPFRVAVNVMTRQRPMSMMGSGARAPRYPRSFAAAMGSIPGTNPDEMSFFEEYFTSGQLPGGLPVRSNVSDPTTVGGAVAGTAGRTSTAFAPQETTITALMEMGFDRSLITRTINILQTNDTETLVQFLLESAYMLDDLERAVTNARSNSVPSTSSSNRPSSDVAPPVTEISPAPAPETVAASTLPSSSVSEEAIQLPTSSSNFDAKTTSQFDLILPKGMQKKSEADIKKMRDFTTRLLVYFYDTAIDIFLHAVQFGNYYKHIVAERGADELSVGVEGGSVGSGPDGSITIYDIDLLPSNACFKRETYTMNMLNLMLKTFEKLHAPDGVVRLVQLQWLSSHLTTILDCNAHHSSLYLNLSLQGLLHAIVILLFSKISPSSMTMAQRANSVSVCELHYLVFTHDERFNRIYDQLLDYMSKVVQQSQSCADIGTLEWLTCATLFFDTLSNHILLDSDVLRTLLTDIDNIHKFNPGSFSELTTLQSTPDLLLTSQVREQVLKVIGSAEGAPGPKSSSIFDRTRRNSEAIKALLSENTSAMNKTEPSASTVTDSGSNIKAKEPSATILSTTLPFHNGCLSMRHRLQCVKIVAQILNLQATRVETNTKNLIQLFQGSYQFLLHLLTSDELRNEFILQKGHIMLLKNRYLLFDNYLLSLYSVLQRCLEDDDSIYHSMLNTVKLIYLKLQKQAHFVSPVYLKSLIEMCCAMIQRDAEMFMKVVDELFEITPDKASNSQLAIELKGEDVVKAMENATPELFAQRARGNSSYSQSEEAEGSNAKRRKLNDSRAVDTTPSVDHNVVANLNRSRGNSLSRTKHRTQLSLEIVKEICATILQQYLIASYLHSNSHVINRDFKTLNTCLISLSDCLILLADLISSMPALLLTLQKLQVTRHDQDQYSINIQGLNFAEFDDILGVKIISKDILIDCPIPSPASFMTTFVQYIHAFSYTMLTTDKTLVRIMKPNSSDSKISRVATIMKTLLGDNIFEGSCYMLGALLSRVGNLRRALLQSLVDSVPLDAPIVLPNVSCFADTVTKLLHPPKSWSNRDAFVYLLQDILVDMLSLGYPVRLVNIFNKIDATKQGGQVILSALSNALEMIYRKGVNLLGKVNYNPAVTTLASGTDSANAPNLMSALDSATEAGASAIVNEESMMSSFSQAYDNSFMLLSNNNTQIDHLSDEEDEDLNMMAARLNEAHDERSVNHSEEEQDNESENSDDIEIEEEEELEEDSEDSDGNDDHNHDHGHHHDEDSDEDHNPGPNHDDHEGHSQSESDHDHNDEEHSEEQNHDDGDDEDDEDDHDDDNDDHPDFGEIEEDDEADDSEQNDEGEEIQSNDDYSEVVDNVWPVLRRESDHPEIPNQNAGEVLAARQENEEENDGEMEYTEDAFNGMLEEYLDEAEVNMEEVDPDDEPQSELQDLLGQSPSNGLLEEDEYSASEQQPGLHALHSSAGNLRMVRHHNHQSNGRNRRILNPPLDAHDLSDALPMSFLEDMQRFGNPATLMRSSGTNHLGGSGSMLNNFQELMSSIIPEGAISSASFARVDANTGTVTLSFSRRPNGSVVSSQPPTGNQQVNIQGVTPSVHPLLSAGNDTSNLSRRNSLLSAMNAPMLGGSRTAGNNNIYFSASLSGGPNNSMNNSYVMNDGSHRSNRNVNTARRRTMGPIVSDRRWGIDIAENDSFNLRINALISNIERYLLQKSNVGGILEDKAGKSRDLINLEDIGQAMRYDESKEEGELQETKDDVGDRLASSTNNPIRSPWLSLLGAPEDLRIRLGSGNAHALVASAPVPTLAPNSTAGNLDEAQSTSAPNVRAATRSERLSHMSVLSQSYMSEMMGLISNNREGPSPPASSSTLQSNTVDNSTTHQEQPASSVVAASSTVATLSAMAAGAPDGHDSDHDQSDAEDENNNEQGSRDEEEEEEIEDEDGDEGNLENDDEDEQSEAGDEHEVDNGEEGEGENEAAVAMDEGESQSAEGESNALAMDVSEHGVSGPSSTSSFPLRANPVLLSEENIEFIATLPEELRQEVLLNSDDGFLITLTQDMVDEALQYREAQLLSLQYENYSSQPEIPSAVVNSPPPAAVSLPVANAANTAPPLISMPSIPFSRTESISAMENKDVCEGLLVLQEIQQYLHDPVIERKTEYSTSVKTTTLTIINGINTITEVDLPTISVKDYDGVNNGSQVLLYNTMFITRILSTIFDMNRIKISKSFLKLLINMLKDVPTRKPMISLLLSILQGQHDTIAYYLQQCLERIDSKSHLALKRYQMEALQRELQTFLPAIRFSVSNRVNVYILRKFLSLFIFLLKKTDNLLWYTFMDYNVEKQNNLMPTSSSLDNRDVARCRANSSLLTKQTLYKLYETDKTPIKEQTSFFLLLCSLFADYLPTLSSSDIEMCLQVIEEMTIPYNKSTVLQANQVYYHTVRRLATKDNAQNLANREADKKDEIRQDAIVEEGKESKPMDVIRDQSLLGHPLRALFGQGSKSNTKTLPFIILSEADMVFYTNIILNTDLSTSSKKRLMRIMRHLSLCNNNWHMFLIHCVYLANTLSEKCVEQYQENYEQLCQNSGDPEMSMYIDCTKTSSTRQRYESKLLTTLKMMTILRARSSSSAQVECLAIAHYMTYIQCHNLWDVLLQCLDHVRVIEERHHAVSNPSSSTTEESNADKISSKHISSYTMQFIPLIECFLSYIGTTLCLKNVYQSSSLAQATTAAAKPTETINVNLQTVMSVHPPPLEGTEGFKFQGSIPFIQDILQKNNQYLVQFAEHNQTLLNIILKSNIHLLETSFAPLITHPICRNILHFDIKRIYFKNKLKKLKYHGNQASQQQSGGGYLRLHVRRENVFEESFQSLRYKTAVEMRKKLSIMFHNEEGMDAGGVTREWYQILSKQMFNPNYALFNTIYANIFQPNPQSYINPDHLFYFKFIGRIIGKAICDNVALDVHFSRSFYKHILGQKIQYTDLESTDPDYYKSLQMLMTHNLEDLGLELTFSTETLEFGKMVVKDLVPNGHAIAVTEENKHEYVKQIAHYRMTVAIEKQTQAFREGFYELVPMDLISLFDAQELELLISGLPDIDLEDLRANTEYHGYTINDVIISRFWNVLRGFSQEEKALFLQFVTGTSKVPLDGFKALQGSDGIKKFNIHRIQSSSHLLPTAHTCFNQLDLPEYSTEDALREKLLLAIKEGATGFGFA